MYGISLPPLLIDKTLYFFVLSNKREGNMIWWRFRNYISRFILTHCIRLFLLYSHFTICSRCTSRCCWTFSLFLLRKWSAIDVTEVIVWIESSRSRRLFLPVDEMRKVIFALSADRLSRLTSVRSHLSVDWSKRILFFLFEFNQLFVFSPFFTMLFVCCGYTHNFPSTPLVFEWGREEKTPFLLSLSLSRFALSFLSQTVHQGFSQFIKKRNNAFCFSRSSF